MAETKTCKQCNQQFEIADADLEFYHKVSPTFAGKTYEIPAPTLCPDCRRQRRLAWRNMSKIYKRKCDFSGEEIITSYPPDSRHIVYKNSIWWSDQWDQYKYGRDFDFKRPFFEQLQELHLVVPKMQSAAVNLENSEFTNNITDARNCYLVQNSTSVENCFYSQGLWRVKDSMDCFRLWDSEYCYETLISQKCYLCFYCINAINCRESLFLDDCVGCKNCFACANLSNKQYWIYNKQSTKEEFEKARNEFLNLTDDERKNKISEIRKFLSSQPKRFTHLTGSEDSTGDNVYNSKNAMNCFYVSDAENFKNVTNVNSGKNSFDHDFWGDKSENVYECAEVGNSSSNLIFSHGVFGNCSNVCLSINLYNGSHDCFGCCGLKQAEYCVFNKKYSKEQYEQLVAKIIEHMQKTGEWGEFFPLSMSSRGYNETTAYEYYPLTKEEVSQLGANWQDEDFLLKYDGPFYEPKEISRYVAQKNLSANSEIQKILEGVLKCETTGRPYKLQPQELNFYIKNNLQIPRQHSDQRYENRIKLRNPMVLWHRQCMCEQSGHDHSGPSSAKASDGKRCPNEFETTYAPDRPEKVYCESCYQKSVI